MQKRPKQTQIGFFALIAALILSLTLLAQCGAQIILPGATGTSTPVATPTSPANPTPNAPSAAVQNTTDLRQDVQHVVATVRPGVVFIGIKAHLQNVDTLETIGNGSGAIIDSQGHILTNNHVVADAEALVVSLPDGRSFDATVVGRDPATDLAVIQIQGDNLPVVPLGDSDRLELGDFVVAIGNALGLEGGPSVTVGVVSAKERTIVEETGASISGLIQTDAAINPGNSGGPLVNLQGEIVGINTAVPGATIQGYQPSGIGFSIAINEIKPLLHDLITQGRVIRPYLGIVPVTITPALRAQFGLDATEGVLVVQVQAGTPAAQAGIQEKDILVQADGTPLKTAAELRKRIFAHQIGDSMKLVVLRNGQDLNITVTLSETPRPE